MGWLTAAVLCLRAVEPEAMDEIMQQTILPAFVFRKIIIRPIYLTLIVYIYFQIVRRRTETTHQQRVGRFESRGY